MVDPFPAAVPGLDDKKSAKAYRTISEVADFVELPQHVLRFWETRFAQLRPMKRGGNRRYYRPEDVDLVHTIKILLHDDGMTIKGVQKLFREQGTRKAVRTILERDREAGGLGALKGFAAPEAVETSGEIDRSEARRILRRLKSLRSRLSSFDELPPEPAALDPSDSPTS